MKAEGVEGRGSSLRGSQTTGRGNGSTTAKTRDFRRLLYPRGIAIVGASSDPSRIGGQPIAALTAFGYEGKIYPINPKYQNIAGLPCYPSIEAAPDPCDVALVAVPAKLVPEVIRSCGKRRIPFAVVLTSGFREIGERGAPLQAELDMAIESSEVSVIGPNCQGLMNIASRVYCGFGAAFQNPHPYSGSIAMITQSGGFGYAVLGLAEHAGIGFNYVVSTGNEADITMLDLIEFLLERPEVEIVATYMEGVTDGRRLLAIGERALELGKPILVWKVGNSDTGRQAAASHTANLSSSYELYKTAFENGGFIEVRDVDDLVNVSEAFKQGRLPRGRNVAVMSVSGGAGVLLADRCEECGLQLPPLSSESIEELKTFMPEFASLVNPIDVTAQLLNDFDIFGRALNTAFGDPGIDLVILYFASVQGKGAKRLAEELVALIGKTAKPVLVSSSAPPGKADEAMEILKRHGVPCFSTPGRAAHAAAALAGFAKKRQSRENQAYYSHAVQRRDLSLPRNRSILGAEESLTCLATYGIPTVRRTLIDLEAAGSITCSPVGFPLVAKLESADLPHKTEAGAVRVGIQDVGELRTAVLEMTAAARRYRPDARINGVSLQEMASGLEVIVGALWDECFGPTIIVGTGGIFAELHRDTVRRFAPIGPDVALDMIRALRAGPIFEGFRGRPALDAPALAELISRLSYLIAHHGDRIREIDINPIFVREKGQGAVAADALMIIRNDE